MQPIAGKHVTHFANLSGPIMCASRSRSKYHRVFNVNGGLCALVLDAVFVVVS